MKKVLHKQNDNTNLIESAREQERFDVGCQRKIMRNIWATIAVIFLTMCKVAQGGAVGNYLEQQAGKYRLKVGIDKIRIAPDHQGVAADWLNPSFPTLLKKEGWLADDSAATGQSGQSVQREWIYRKNDEMLSVEVLVSSAGNQAAMDRLVRIATNRSSGLFIHEKSAGPGDLYVAYSTEGLRDIIWVYRNLCFHIQHADESEPGNQELVFDTYALAREIQQYAEAHLVQNIRSHYPRIARVIIAPEKVHAGDDFTVTLKMEGDTDAKHYGMEFDRSDNLELESIDEGLSIRLQALAPGKGEVRFHVYDTRTLLMTQKTVQIDVREKGK